MDAEVATLAASGASTLVNLMASDAWTKAKELVHKIFAGSAKGAPDKLLAELDSTRSALAIPNGVEQNSVSLAEMWTSKLGEAVAEGWISQEGLVTLAGELAALAEKSSVAGSGTVNMSAIAQNGGKVYQQGSGIQINS